MEIKCESRHCEKIIDVDNRYLKVKDVTGLIVYVSKNNIVSITLA